MYLGHGKQRPQLKKKTALHMFPSFCPLINRTPAEHNDCYQDHEWCTINVNTLDNSQMFQPRKILTVLHRQYMSQWLFLHQLFAQNICCLFSLYSLYSVVVKLLIVPSA